MRSPRRRRGACARLEDIESRGLVRVRGRVRGRGRGRGRIRVGVEVGLRVGVRVRDLGLGLHSSATP